MIFFCRLIQKAEARILFLSADFLKMSQKKSNLEKCFYIAASGTRAKAMTSLLLNSTFLHSNIPQIIHAGVC